MRQTHRLDPSAARASRRGRNVLSLFSLAVTVLLAACGSNPVATGRAAQGGGFYVDPYSNPAIWVRNNPGDPRMSRIDSAIASQPMARWFGNWSGDIGQAVGSFVDAASAAGQMPILVAYNIPGRDCGSHSGGGAGSPEAYRAWISAFAAAIGDRPAVVVIEPDALAQLDCLDPNLRATRIELLRYAASEFKQRAAKAQAYHDGGNANWIAADEMARRLNSADVGAIQGFSVNVSNYYRTDESERYGANVSGQLQSQFGYGKAFVVDTSRNGNGSNGEWCNPAGRKLGETSREGSGGAQMLLWLKVPGDSDGQCGIAPGTPAGVFSPEIAERLIDGR